MKHSIASQLTAIACVTAVAGCSYTKTFGYTPHYEVQAAGEDPDPAPVEARQLLASAKVVAFFPPDRCVVTTDKDDLAEKQFRANCSVLLSYLEHEAEKAGYEVVSWANLRGSQRPIEYAREAHVDVLFEMNEITSERIQPDANMNRSLAFFDRTDHGDVSFNPSTEVAQRCYGWSKDHDTPQLGDIATIDIKTVSVADGRSRWHYRKSQVINSDTHPASERFVGKSEPNKLGNGLGAAGTVTLLLSGMFAGIDYAINHEADPVTGVPKKLVFGSLPYYGMGIGAALLAAGIVLVATQGQTKPTPDDTMCLQNHIPNNGLYEGGDAPQPAVVYTGTSGGQATFSEHNVQQGTIDKAKQAKEIHDSVQEFVQQLADVKQHPPTPAPAPAPAPAPPAATPTQP